MPTFAVYRAHIYSFSPQKAQDDPGPNKRASTLARCVESFGVPKPSAFLSPSLELAEVESHPWSTTDLKVAYSALGYQDNIRHKFIGDGTDHS